MKVLLLNRRTHERTHERTHALLCMDAHVRAYLHTFVVNVTFLQLQIVLLKRLPGFPVEIAAFASAGE